MTDPDLIKRVLLDGRPIRTQGGGAPQVVPTRALAELLAEEWAAQGEEIEAGAFQCRDMADYAIDKVADAPRDTIDKLLRFAETDTLCYRADPDEPLWKRQQSVWEPIVTAFEAREGVRLERVSGIVHRQQPEATLAALRTRLDALDPFTLAALEAMTSLSTSLCVGLSALDPASDAEALWAAAELEEAWLENRCERAGKECRPVERAGRAGQSPQSHLEMGARAHWPSR